MSPRRPVQTTLACPHDHDGCHGPRAFDGSFPCFECYRPEADCPHGNDGCHGPHGDTFPCWECYQRGEDRTTTITTEAH